MSEIRDIPMTMLDGADTTFGGVVGDRAVLVVNVASKCGLTPQYADLEALQKSYARPGLHACSASRATSSAARSRARAEEIADVLLDHLRRHVPDVREDRGQRRRTGTRSTRSSPRSPTPRARRRHPVELREVPRRPDGGIVARFHHKTLPSAPHVREAIEAVLPTPSPST